MNRREVLRLLAGALLLGMARRPALADPRSPNRRWERLRARVEEAIGGQTMALDLRWLDDAGAFEAPAASDAAPSAARDPALARLAINDDALLPVASAFKAFAALYYLWTVPADAWRVDPDSPVYRMCALSDNIMTGQVIADAAPYVTLYGNPLEKFNDFLIYTLKLTDGLYTWRWAGNPIENVTDPRFAPSATRYALVGGVAHSVDNLMTARGLADGYAFLHAPPPEVLPAWGAEHGALAVAETLRLLSIPARNYQPPIERAGLGDYIGKDGILQQDDLSTGNVVVDAGLVTVADPLGGSGGRAISPRRYILAFMSAGQSEFRAVETLRAVAQALVDF
jgi:hypothetical protein